MYCFFLQVISYSGNAISVLLSLLTIEAQSYGSQACIHMRVVENTMEVDIPPDVANVPSVHIEESPSKSDSLCHSYC